MAALLPQWPDVDRQGTQHHVNQRSRDGLASLLCCEDRSAGGVRVILGVLEEAFKQSSYRPDGLVRDRVREADLGTGPEVDQRLPALGVQPGIDQQQVRPVSTPTRLKVSTSPSLRSATLPAGTANATPPFCSTGSLPTTPSTPAAVNTGPSVASWSR
jgi:hypothetical protein